MDNSRENIANLLGANLTFFNKISMQEQSLLTDTAQIKTYPKNDHLYQGGGECSGLIILLDGQIRAYISSSEGKEITLYRLLSGDTCIMSASCMLKDINFDINLDMEKDCQILLIPSHVFEGLSNKNPLVKEFTLSLVSSRFTDVMWALEQFVFSSMGKRLAGFLVNQSILNSDTKLLLTHEYIANDLGTAREVITRLLKYFQDDGLVLLSRGSLEILDIDKLKKLA
ncbi:MAG: Crp/Fnr family transcriptional regulator [Eubacteriales bacterium]